MAPKKKGKGKKKKKAAGPKYDYEIPAYKDPKIFTPKVELTIRLAAPANDFLTFKLNVPITTTIDFIRRKIIEKHEGAIGDVTICLNRFKEEEAVSPDMRLCDLGVVTAGECKVYYDYKPVNHPLLITN